MNDFFIKFDIDFNLPDVNVCDINDLEFFHSSSFSNKIELNNLNERHFRKGLSVSLLTKLLNSLIITVFMNLGSDVIIFSLSPSKRPDILFILFISINVLVTPFIGTLIENKSVLILASSGIFNFFNVSFSFKYRNILLIKKNKISIKKLFFYLI